MATNYKNILLKDNTGKILLPITLSYYVEYKDGISVQSYLDTLSNDIDDVQGAIDVIEGKIANNGEVQQNIINTINDVLLSYVQKPDHASYVVFDNTTNNNLSENLKNLSADPNLGYVSTQQAIEALDSSVKTVTSYANELGGKIDTAEGDIDAIESAVSGLDNRVTAVETQSNYSYTKVNELFDSNGDLDLIAGAVKYTGSVEAGTESLTGNSANVQSAIDYLGAELKTVQTGIEGVISQAGVTYVTGSGGILVNNRSNERQQGAVTVSINLDNDKLIYDNGAITVDDSKLSIAGSQITGYISSDQIDGGLGADNITITYSYTDGGAQAEGEKSVQEFYNETQTTLTEIQSNVNALSTSYQVTVTDDQGANTSYARVYTLSQGGSAIGTINIPKDQFLRSVEYSYAQDGTTPALVFHWQLPNADADTVDTTYVPITEFIDAITENINEKVSELETDVEKLQESVSTIESSYITGATIDGQSVTVNADRVLEFSYVALYTEGTSSESISQTFLDSHGITLS